VESFYRRFVMYKLSEKFSFRLSEELIKKYPRNDFLYKAELYSGDIDDGTYKITWTENKSTDDCSYDAKDIKRYILYNDWIIEN
jgi:hypothetical protein